MKKEELIKFEDWTVKMFNEGKIKSPVHLSGSIDGIQEDKLIEIFKDIKPQDWVFTTYRSHYHALLKGVPEERLKKWILDNKSIHFMDSEYNVFSSAIVGGTLPIALGVAMAVKKKEVDGLDNAYKNLSKNAFIVENNWRENHPHIWCFIGDMTASLGVFRDCHKYANYHQLPITFIIEDNGLSTDTITKEVWGKKPDSSHWFERNNSMTGGYKNIIYYRYRRKYPHYGSGKFIAKLWEGIDEARSKGF